MKGRETLLSSEVKEISESIEHIETGESGGEDDSNERSLDLEEKDDTEVKDDYEDHDDHHDLHLPDTVIIMTMVNLFLETREIGRMSSVDLNVTPLLGPLASKSSSSSMLESFLLLS